MSRPITGSSLGLAMSCPASHVLPQVFSEPGPAAERGSVLHAYIRDALEHGEEVAIESVPKRYQSDAAGIDLSAIRELIKDGKPRFEVAFALNVSTGNARVIGDNIGRNYGDLADTEIAMTADLVIDRGNDRGEVIDWKTGHGAADSWQIRALSVAAAGAFGWDNVVGAFAYLQEDGSWRPIVEEYSSIDLDANLSAIRGTVYAVRAINKFRIDGATVSVTEGRHCTYCPAKLHCPPHIARLAAISNSPLVRNEGVCKLSAEKLGELYSLIRFYEQHLKASKEFIEEAAKDGAGIPLPNGKILKGVEVQREYVDGAAAYDLIVEGYGHDAANEACEMRASKEGIKRAFGKKADKVIDKLRDAGAIRTVTHWYAKEVKQ